MSIAVKICGLRDEAAVAAAIKGGASYAGFVFYPPSPRAIDAKLAGDLIRKIPPEIVPVGLFVDPTDEQIMDALHLAPLRVIQLHGGETLERVKAIKRMTGFPIIKAIGIAASSDIEKARNYETVADILLLDAAPPPNGLSGGNAVSFDWSLLKKVSFARPWMLAGGLTVQNMAEAVATSGARILDVSSGVESEGVKNPAKIKDFLAKARDLETCC